LFNRDLRQSVFILFLFKEEIKMKKKFLWIAAVLAVFLMLGGCVTGTKYRDAPDMTGLPHLAKLQVRDLIGVSSLEPPFAPHIFEYEMFAPEWNTGVLFETTPPAGYTVDFASSRADGTEPIPDTTRLKNGTADPANAYGTGPNYLADWPQTTIAMKASSAYDAVMTITVTDASDASKTQDYVITVKTADGTPYTDKFVSHQGANGYKATGGWTGHPLDTGRPHDGYLNGFILPVAIYVPDNLTADDYGKIPVITYLHGAGGHNGNIGIGLNGGLWVKDAIERGKKAIVVIPQARYSGDGVNSVTEFIPWSVAADVNPATPDSRDNYFSFRTGNAHGNGFNGLLKKNCSYCKTGGIYEDTSIGNEDYCTHRLARPGLAVKELLDKLMSGPVTMADGTVYNVSQYIDPKRMHITGTSAGGQGVVAMASEYPGFWASALPGCPLVRIRVSEANEPGMDDMAWWFFHGEHDDVSVGNSQASADILRFARYPIRGETKTTKDVRLTIYDRNFFFIENHHSVGMPGYGNVELRDWVFNQMRP
jgi:poly(3-hydroxybutyrate) depolymerase